jgi:hypothetical protein
VTPVPCAHCRGPVADTAVGWTHVDHRGALVGWLCPLPRMTLATPTEPAPELQREPVPPNPVGEVPGWVQALQIPTSYRHRAP